MGCTPNCGACCDPVNLPEDQALKLFGATAHRIDPLEVDKILELWEPVGHTPAGKVRLICAAYDVETRSCTAYDDRPKVCSGFPWYGRGPVEGKLEDSTVCGYVADLGRTVLPIVEVR